MQDVKRGRDGGEGGGKWRSGVRVKVRGEKFEGRVGKRWYR